MKAKYLNPKTVDDIRGQDTTFFLTAFAMVLHDKHGEDKAAIHKTLEQTMYLVDSFSRGDLSVDDAQKTLYEEADVVIR